MAKAIQNWQYVKSSSASPVIVTCGGLGSTVLQFAAYTIRYEEIKSLRHYCAQILPHVYPINSNILRYAFARAAHRHRRKMIFSKIGRFFRKIFLSVRRRVIAMTMADWCVLQRDDIFWLVDQRDQRMKWYFKYCAGWHHPEDVQIKMLLQLCEQVRPTVLIDIGANYGHYSLYLLRHCSDITRALAFEPAADMVRYLHTNVLLNRQQERLHIYPIALGARTGDAVLLIDPCRPCISTLPDTDRGKYILNATRQPVQIDTLDNTAQIRGETLLIKIDVEGGELAVLQGAQKTLQENNCLVQIEVFDNHRKAVEEFFAAIGYQFIDEISHINRADMWYSAPALNLKKLD